MIGKVRTHFKQADPILYSVMGSLEPIEISTTGNYFSDLCETIVNQQLSEKAGATIWKRFRALLPKGKVTPQRVLALPDKKIRKAGVSRSKITYLKNLAARVRGRTLSLHELATLPDGQVIEQLTTVKGIGLWTAEMFLMFSLGRDDVFSFGDVGLRNAIKRLYKFKNHPTQRQMEKIVQKWSPYRTWAARILWNSLGV